MHCCAMSIISIIICINNDCAGIERGRDSDRCIVTVLLLVGVGTVLFGFIQVCEAYARQTAEYLHNVQRHVLQSLQ